MKILLVHNYYRSGAPSGEDKAVEQQLDLLRSAGHECETWTRHSDELAGRPDRLVAAALFNAWNPISAGALARRCAQVQPEIVHFHNTFPLIGWSPLAAARASGAAVVTTLHNYRSFCAVGTLIRDGRGCMLCAGRAFPWPAVRYGCYRDSRLATLPIAAGIALNRAAGWLAQSDRIVAVSAAERDLLVAGGMPAERMEVLHHYTDAPAQACEWHEREPGVVFLGRLDGVKGCDVLLRAWSAAPVDWRLDVIGDGPDRQRLEALSGELGISARVRFHGLQPHPEAMRLLAGARLLCVPSVWPETFGIAIIEAYARGVPVLASRIGGPAELVEPGVTGALAEPGDVDGWRQALASLLSDDARLATLGRAAQARWRTHFTRESALRRLDGIYFAARQARTGAVAPPTVDPR